MSQSTINPYSTLGTDFSNGLVTFIGAFSTTVTLSELITEINTIIEGDFYTSASAQQQIEINGNTTNAINSYVNGLLWGNKTIYNARQMKFIRMLSREALRKIEVVALNNYLLDVEDNITKSDLTVPEQIPLLIATMLGETAFSYWNTDVNATGASQKWTGYYQSNQAYNYANIPSWVAAAIEGALVGYGSSMDASLEPTTAMVSSKMIAALQGALAVNIALVALQMIPRIQPSAVVNSVFNTFSGNAMMGGGNLSIANRGRGRGRESDIMYITGWTRVPVAGGRTNILIDYVDTTTNADPWGDQYCDVPADGQD